MLQISNDQMKLVGFKILANIWQFSRHGQHKKLISLDSFDTTFFVLTSYFINETFKS